jgi:hypothetical protein
MLYQGCNILLVDIRIFLLNNGIHRGKQSLDLGQDGKARVDHSVDGKKNQCITRLLLVLMVAAAQSDDER